MQVATNIGASPGVLVGRELVIRAAIANRRDDMLRRKHPRENSVMRAFNARQVDEACGAADQRAAGKRELLAPIASRLR